MKTRGLFIFGDIGVFIADPHRYKNPDGTEILEGEIIVINRNSRSMYSETQVGPWRGSFLETAKRSGLETIRRLCLAREDPDFLLLLAKGSFVPADATQEAETMIKAATAFGSALDEACGIADIEESLDVAELERIAEKLGIDLDELDERVRRMIEEKNPPESE